MSEEKKRPVGHPTNYTPELGDRICHLVATHPIGYEHIQKMFPDELPLRGVVREWRKRFPEFNAKYLAAKSFQAELMVEEIDEMLPDDIRTYYDAEGNERIDSPSASMMIAKINNRKWMAARLAPKRYGDQGLIDSLHGENAELKKELQELREQLDAKNRKEY